MGLVKFVVPRIPSMVTTAISHSLSLSPTASKWDLRTEMTVHLMRSITSPGGSPKPVGEIQARTLRDPGVKGKMWIAKATIPVPEDETLREATFKAIEDMGDGSESYTKPALAPLNVEWTGYRSEAGKEDPLPDISEEEKFSKLMADPNRNNATTVLYFHGGSRTTLKV